MRRRSITVWLIYGCAVIQGCAGARFGVRVWGPNDQLLQGMRVTVASRKEDVCSEQTFATGISDKNGLAKMMTEWCSVQKLIVSGRGMRTSRQIIDTCETTFVNVTLKPARAARQPSDPCAEAAQDFIRALLYDRERVPPMLIYPELQPDYEDAFGLSDTWGIDIESSNIRDRDCRVVLGVFNNYGCIDRWAIDLRRDGESWRVRDLATRQNKDLDR